jgi:hypothetical protein
MRSIRQLCDLLAPRHPDVALADVRRAACAALIIDDREVEVSRLRAENRRLWSRIGDLQRELQTMRDTRLDLWLGLEAERHGDPA